MLFTLWFLTLGYGYNIYFANLHSHTEFSDGKGLPEEAYIYARDSAQIDILALSDHTHLLNEISYQYQKQIAERYTENGYFLALVGQEFGNLNQFGHLTIFDADSLCPISTANLAKTYQWLNSKGLIAQFNHPRQSDFNYLAFDFNGDQWCSMIEVVNGSGNYTELNEEIYFTGLANGWHLAPVANQDNHNKKWGDAMTSLGQIPLTGILADTLTKEAVLNALHERRIYALETRPKTDRIRLKNFMIDNIFMGGRLVTSNPSVLIKLEVVAETGFSQIYLYKNGVKYDSVNTLNRDSIVWCKADTSANGYYFIKGIQLDGDRFWSAPIWVEYQPASPNLLIMPNPLRTEAKITFINPNAESIANPILKIYNLIGEKVYETSDALTTSTTDFIRADLRGIQKRKETCKQSSQATISFVWQGNRNDGKKLSNGVYFAYVRWGIVQRGKIIIER